MTHPTRAAIEERLRKATPGRWRREALGGVSTVLTTAEPPKSDRRCGTYGYRNPGEHCIAHPFLDDSDRPRMDFVCFGHDDAELIAHAKTDIAWLLSEIDRLTELLGRKR